MLRLSATLKLSGCATKEKYLLQPEGAVAGANVTNPNRDLERCDFPLGTLVIDDDRERDWYQVFRKITHITTIEPLIRSRNLFWALLHSVEFPWMQ